MDPEFFPSVPSATIVRDRISQIYKTSKNKTNKQKALCRQYRDIPGAFSVDHMELGLEDLPATAAAEEEEASVLGAHIGCPA